MPRPLRNLVRACSVIATLWCFLLALVLGGCEAPATTDPPDPEPDAGPTPCVPGELTREDGTCQPAGLPPDMPCPPGELLLDDGITCQPAGLPPDMPCPPGEWLRADGVTCQKAGVPASECGKGFLPDGKDGCEAILPAEPCAEGLMAVPGDTECHEVAPCGSGTWGDIPIEANTQFVDQAYAGGDSDGTQAKPWTGIKKGIYAAEKGAIVAVAAGSYSEEVVIEVKAVRLWGRCPAMVEVVGTGVNSGGILVLKKAADGSEIHGVAVAEAEFGIGVSGASDVLIEGVCIHGTSEEGLNVQDDLGLTSVVMKGSLVEQNHKIGVLVAGSEVTIEATVVRSTLPDGQGKGGRGIGIQDASASKARANVIVRSCVIEQNRDSGVYVGGSDATIEATVVRSTLADGQGSSGHGIRIQDNPTTSARANVTVRACLVEQNHEVGVNVSGSDTTIEATVVRSTLADGQGMGGRGINVQDGLTSMERANVNVRACLVEQNHEIGVLVSGSDATVEATVVRSTQPDAQGSGIGIEAVHANVAVWASLLEQNHEAGVFVASSEAIIESSVVRSNQPDAQGNFGRGIIIQLDPDTGERANVTVRACVIEQHHEDGVFVAGSDATIENTVIRSTQPDPQWEVGRGIDIQPYPDTEERANVMVRACLIEQSHEVGVFIEGSDMTIEATVIRSALPDALGNGGRGISIQTDPDTKEGSSAVIRACVVEQNQDIGVYVSGSDATIVDSIVRETAPQKSDTQFGDGIAVLVGDVTIQNTQVTFNARAGVAAFGGQVLISDSVMTCNGFDLEGEAFDDTPFSFDGSTGWQCSDKAPAACTELDECHVETTGIKAPAELPPIDPPEP